jgi:hypothetical protein
MKEPFGCDFSLWQRQTAVSDWISTYSKDEERKFDLYVGDIDVEDFKNTVTLRFRPQGEKKTMALNRVMLIRNHPLAPLRGE